MKKLLLSVLMGMALQAIHAQEDSSAVDSHPAKSYGKLSVNYTSNSVFNGRKDSLITPYISPTLGYYAKSGFFIDGSVSYLARQGSGRIDLTTIETGWDFNAGNFDGEVMASKFFYNSSSTNTRSEVEGSLAASAGYDFGFIHPTVQGTMNFGKKTNDYALGVTLDHAFYAAADKLVITPTALMNASTQNYYGSYYNGRRYSALRKTYYYVSVDLTDASRFKILDYEFNLPVEYTAGKWTFSVTPTYAIPVNAAVVSTTIKSTSSSTAVTRYNTEKIANTFFMVAEVAVKF